MACDCTRATQGESLGQAQPEIGSNQADLTKMRHVSSPR